MATNPRERLDRQRQKVDALADGGGITPETRDAMLEFADALDSQKVRYTYYDAEGDVRDYPPRTVEGYLECMRLSATRGLDVLGASTADVNDFMDSLVDDHGLQKSTVARYQSAAQAFYRYHDIGVAADDIRIFNERSKAKHDEQDLLTEDDVFALRRACGATTMPTRNRALLELLIHTGQRITGLLTLRVKDVELNPEEGSAYIYLNDEYDDENGGLKGALERGRKRPIYGARKYVRDWLQYHPNGDDPEAWLFIGNPSHWKTDVNDHWAEPSADQTLRRIAASAGVEKPCNAHNFRHYFATIMYRDYDVDKDTIRHHLGHHHTSRSLEETYSHVFDGDYIERGERAMGYRDEEDAKSFTPKTCPTCDEVLKSGWTRCPNCPEVFGPNPGADSIAEVREQATEEAVEATDAQVIAALQGVRDDSVEPADAAAIITDALRTDVDD